MTDSQREILRQWRRVIEAEKDRSTACVPDDNDYRMPCDPALLTDWLWVESSLTKPALEEKIRGFVKSGHWGELTAVEHFYLVKRLDHAGLVIEDILNGHLQELEKKIPRWPTTFDDQSEMTCWLLIEVWNVFEEWYLAHWADWFLKGVIVSEEAQTWRWKAPPPDC